VKTTKVKNIKNKIKKFLGVENLKEKDFSDNTTKSFLKIKRKQRRDGF
jgi:hypothetical protein